MARKRHLDTDNSIKPFEGFAYYNFVGTETNSARQKEEHQERYPQKFGGCIGRRQLATGGSIHINPANRGKFNATKARTGKTTEELTHSKNPLTRKRAIFAQNAAKWHH